MNTAILLSKMVSICVQQNIDVKDFDIDVEDGKVEIVIKGDIINE